tara:strand:+ start:1557 stop:2102 length:546 start_codon:yes stop_codon:yes gene_type:complete
MPYGNQDGPKMESAKQQKYDLLHDNPVAKDASGGRPWIAKHFKSTMGSAMKMGHESPNEMGHEGSPAEKELVGNQKNLPKHLRDAIEAAPEMKMDGMSMKEGMHMNYDGVSKKYPAAVHNDEEKKDDENVLTSLPTGGLAKAAIEAMRGAPKAATAVMPAEAAKPQKMLKKIVKKIKKKED